MRLTQNPERRVAVVGGGINGAGVAWELARRDYDVVLFDKGECGAATSSRSTKMIHGGLRYLENLQFGVVRESLRDRAWLLEHLPQLVKPIEILLPVYDDSPRSRLTIRIGLTLYDLLAGGENIRRHRSLTRDEIVSHGPLLTESLRGGFSYWDAQVDDFALVRTVIASAAAEGAAIRENTRVDALRRDRKQWIVAGEHFDLVVNAVGPWMNEFLGRSRIRPRYVLSLIRGSHLVLKRRVSDVGFLLQSIGDKRVFFVLPWKATSLVGTTEVVHRGSLDDVHPSEDEIDYLIARFNHYFRDKIGREDIDSTFAGVRPLVGRATNPGAISRDARVNRSGSLINIFGGKLTTFMSLARKVALRVDNYFGAPRTAREPVFRITG
ncbi:MAG TPA: glycerol-3-phosphate dehydrogenase/oxidase [Thermoanaerobaculia bacterium]|nr:glycerol-3-phosphate dehydrogenase/oxidase [Thermoanaerobaculia bacterium]